VLRPISSIIDFKSRGKIGQLREVKGSILCGMFIGAHFLLLSKDPEADRAFFRDVLGFPHIDAGHGWLIFATSPAEMAIHPMEDGPSPRPPNGRLLDGTLYLMCNDLDASLASLQAKQVKCGEVENASWGRVTKIPLPSGSSIGLYQPRHTTAWNLSSLNSQLK
jgi:catechol 2,3-dioxygenase-like lactoylglutathione lyase family enzyme